MEERWINREQIKRRLSEIKVGGNVSVAVPRISVIIPVYNVASFVEETLNSVFAQTYKDYEVVVVNDGSQDTPELNSRLAPYLERIVYAEQANLGAAQARNSAICLARGELFAFLDGDDVWLPDFLASQVNFLEKNNLEMVYCDAQIFGEPLYAGKTYMETAPSDGEVTTDSLISGKCNVITSGTLLKKDLLVKFNLFDTEVSRVEDFDLWFRLAKNGAKIGYQRKVLLRYRVRPGNLSGSNVQRVERSVFAFETIQRKYELNESEERILDKRKRMATAELHLETGKFHLAQGNFSAANFHFLEANKFHCKLKLRVVTWLVRFSPNLILLLFKKLRPSEFFFIRGDKS